MNHMLNRINNAVLYKELAPGIIFLPFESNNQKLSTLTEILHLTFIIFKTTKQDCTNKYHVSNFVVCQQSCFSLAWNLDEVHNIMPFEMEP